MDLFNKAFNGFMVPLVLLFFLKPSVSYGIAKCVDVLRQSYSSAELEILAKRVVEAGYDSAMANRLVRLRPEVARKISQDPVAFAPIRSFRGLTVPPSKFDPKYTDFKYTYSEKKIMYVATVPETALMFSNGGGTLIEFEFPKAFLRDMPLDDWIVDLSQGGVDFNVTPFITRIGRVYDQSQGNFVTSDKYRIGDNIFRGVSWLENLDGFVIDDVIQIPK